MAHVHAPQELPEPAQRPEGEEQRTARRERRLELIAVVLLSVAILATAWSGYQAARWSGQQSQDYAEASALRAQAEEQSTLGYQDRAYDVSLVNGWFDAYATGNYRLANEYRHRFRPGFQPIFTAWLALHPLTNPTAPPGPTYMPQYYPTPLALSDALSAQATRGYLQGTQAKTDDDRYILATLLFAAVLILAAVSLRLNWIRLRIAVLAFGGLVFVGTVVFVSTLPTTT